MLRQSLVRYLPPAFHVSGFLNLNRSAIRTLPPGLWVGSLDLTNTALQDLPSGLWVGDVLDLRHTRITRLPPDLYVGGMILPPDGLADIQTIMANVAGEMVLSFSIGSAHEKMALRQRLTQLPELRRVLDALPGGSALRLNRSAAGAVRAYVGVSF